MLNARKFYRPVALFFCIALAIVGTVSLFFRGGASGPPPDLRQPEIELQASGVSTTAQPVFEIERKNQELVSIAG